MEKTFLIVEKESFKEKIQEQISIGKSLFDKSIRFQNQRDYYGNSFSSDLDEEQKDFLKATRKWKKFVSELLKQSFNVDNNEYLKEFDHSGIQLCFTINSDSIKDAKDELDAKISSLQSIYERVDLIPSEEKEIVEQHKNIDSKNVFIVHGHDEHLRIEVELLIKQLDYNPIVLFKEPNQGQTIIEKIENQAENAAFGIVLYTGCDLGADKNSPENLNLRARQNVVFEHGYLCAKLGRNRVCAICDKDIEIPGDLSGIVYISHMEGWQYKVGNEMKASGLNIDLNKIKI